MTTKTNKPARERPTKLSGTSRILMTTLSLGAFIGGWNLIARLEGNTQDISAAPPVTPTPAATRITVGPSLWPTIEPLPALPPVPKVAPLSKERLAALLQADSFTGIQATISEPVAPVILPEPAPLPTPVPPPAPINNAPAAVNAPAGSIGLLAPLNGSTGGLTIFEWAWNGPIPPNTGFEVMVWRNGEPATGAHDAIADNQNGRIQNLGGGRYRLTLDISGAWGVQGRGGDYLWTVSLVQTAPSYAGLGIQAEPATLRLDTGGNGGGGESSSVGSGGGGNTGGGGGHPSTGS